MIIEGGDLEPKLFVDGMGVLKKKAGLTKKSTFNPVVTSLSPSTGSNQGGQLLKIEGKYFPKGNDTNTTVYQGTIQLQVLKMTNRLIEVMTLKESDNSATKAVIKVSFEGKEATKDYTYSTSNAANSIEAISSSSIAPHTSLDLTLTFSKNLDTDAKYKVLMKGR